jgi:hypothetical protein
MALSTPTSAGPIEPAVDYEAFRRELVAIHRRKQ